MRALAAALLAASVQTIAWAQATEAFDWRPADPAILGMDPARLRATVEQLPAERTHGLHGMVVLRDGKLVLEQYWNGRDPSSRQDIRSATKSITALLVGIAIDRQALAGPQVSMASVLAPAYGDTPALAQPITLEHLLTMRSGLDCDDRNPQSPGHEDTMYRATDWARFYLDLAPVRPAGTQAVYCTGGYIALGEVLRLATGQPVPAFAEEALFAPLGIAGARWSTHARGSKTDTGGHLQLTTRELARIGQLVLDQGRAAGRAVVSEGWIAQATAVQTTIDKGRRYGYGWWIGDARLAERSIRVVSAQGNGGQSIFVVPELRLVAAFTSGNFNPPKAALPMQLLGAHLLPASLGP